MENKKKYGGHIKELSWPWIHIFTSDRNITVLKKCKLQKRWPYLLGVATGLVAERVRFLSWLSCPPNGKQLLKSVDVNLSELLTHNKKLR